MKLEIFVFCLFLLSVNCSTELTSEKKNECEYKDPSNKEDCNNIYDKDLIDVIFMQNMIKKLMELKKAKVVNHIIKKVMTP